MEVLDWFANLKEVFAKRAKRQNGSREVIIVERSPCSSLEIFTTNLFESGLLSEWERSLLERFYNFTRWNPK